MYLAAPKLPGNLSMTLVSPGTNGPPFKCTGVWWRGAQGLLPTEEVNPTQLGMRHEHKAALPKYLKKLGP